MQDVGGGKCSCAGAGAWTGKVGLGVRSERTGACELPFSDELALGCRGVWVEARGGIDPGMGLGQGRERAFTVH
jgi:hypothetical protein